MSERELTAKMQEAWARYEEPEGHHMSPSQRIRYAFFCGWKAAEAQRHLDKKAALGEMYSHGADAFMLGLAGIRRGRAVGKAPELGMGYGGQQPPKEGPSLKDIMEKMGGFIPAESWGGGYPKEGERILFGIDYAKEGTRPITFYSLRDYLPQLHAAAVAEGSYMTALRNEGWQWDSSRGLWWHFWRPSTVIMPG